MKMIRLIPAMALGLMIFFTGCAPKDADIRSEIEKKLKSNPATAAAAVTVIEGVATLSGELADENAKAEAAKLITGIKGVKSVVNNVTLTPPPPVFIPPVITADDPLMQSVKDATKDYPGVKAEVKDGVITLTGDITKASLPKLMMTLNGLNARKIDNKLTIK